MNSKLFPALALTFGIAACGGADEPGRALFRVDEATIAQIHEAMEAGDLRARDLVEAYLARIEEYDRRGPALNALVTVNRHALTRAAELDAAFAKRGLTGPLHGIPVIVKDNYDIAHLPTSAGSLALADSVPPDDAFQVRMIRDAGGIVLAKSNMAEFAFSPYETVGSRLPGYTRNPYALNRVTAGSSGGTAAAVAASFGTVGLGTDTGNSIRGPSAHQALVGIRSTMGLTSRDGIVPLNLARDIGGPIARTVADAVAVLDVIAGHDPADPVTAASLGRAVGPYADALRDDGLRGDPARRAPRDVGRDRRPRGDPAVRRGHRRPASSGGRGRRSGGAEGAPGSTGRRRRPGGVQPVPVRPERLSGEFGAERAGQDPCPTSSRRDRSTRPSDNGSRPVSRSSCRPMSSRAARSRRRVTNSCGPAFGPCWGSTSSTP